MPETTSNVRGFLSELTELSLKHGLALTGLTTVFVMEPEDRQSAYRIDDDSHLTLG